MFAYMFAIELKFQANIIWEPSLNIEGCTSVPDYAQEPGILMLSGWGAQGFFPGGTGVSHLAKILSIPPPIWHLSPFLDQGLSPPPIEVRPWKFEKVKCDYF